MCAYLRSANITDGALDLRDVKQMNFSPAEQLRFALRAGDVLVTEGSGSRETVGASAVWREEIPGTVCFQNTLLRLRPRPQITDGRYLAWWARHAHASGLFSAVASGANILHLGADNLRRLPINLPALDVQRRIADFLDDQVGRLDRAIQLRARQEVLIEDARRVAIAEVFFEHDGGIPSVHLKQVAALRHGRQRSPEHETGEFMTPYIRSANVSDGRLVLQDVKEMNFDPRERAAYGLDAGDVLVTEASGSAASIGASCRWMGEIPSPVCFQNHVIRLRPRGRAVTSDYLYWWARASYASGAMRIWATGANILNLGSDSLGRMPVPARGPDDQLNVVSRCEEIERLHTKLLAAVGRSRSLLTERKRSLITAAVTRQFDVASESPRATEAVMAGTGGAG